MKENEGRGVVSKDKERKVGKEREGERERESKAGRRIQTRKEPAFCRQGVVRYKEGEQ